MHKSIEQFRSIRMAIILEQARNYVFLHKFDFLSIFNAKTSQSKLRVRSHWS